VKGNAAGCGRSRDGREFYLMQAVRVHQLKRQRFLTQPLDGWNQALGDACVIWLQGSEN